MVLDWFDRKAIVAFPGEIAKELEKLRGAGASSTKAAGVNKGQMDQKKLDALIVSVQAFAKKQALNIYVKAKFLNAVKRRPKASGEDVALIDEIVRLRTATFYA